MRSVAVRFEMVVVAVVFGVVLGAAGLSSAASVEARGSSFGTGNVGLSADGIAIGHRSGGRIELPPLSPETKRILMERLQAAADRRTVAVPSLRLILSGLGIDDVRLPDGRRDYLVRNRKMLRANPIGQIGRIRPVIPEAAPGLLAGLGLMGLAMFGRRSRA